MGWGSRGAPRWGCSHRLFLLTVWLCVWIERTSAQDSVVIAEEGQKVNLTAPVKVNILTFTWYRSSAVDEALMILNYVVPGSILTNGSQYTGRETVFLDGTMQIRNVNTSDSGSYYVHLTLSIGGSDSTRRQLRVYGHELCSDGVRPKKCLVDNVLQMPAPTDKDQVRSLLVWLSLWIQQSSARGSGADVVTATVGETVTLTGLFVNATIHRFVWYTGPVVGNTQMIFSYVVSTSLQTNGPQFLGREAGLPDGSMQIRDVRTNYTANYTVNVILGNGSPSTVIRQLVVYETSAGADGGGPGLSVRVISAVSGVSGGVVLVCVLVYIEKKKRGIGS